MNPNKVSFKNHKYNPFRILRAFNYNDNNLYNRVAKDFVQDNDAGIGTNNSPKHISEFEWIPSLPTRRRNTKCFKDEVYSSTTIGIIRKDSREKIIKSKEK